MVDTIDFTIIVCTFNPDRRLLSRCLDAIVRLDHHACTSEVILVDNRSDPPLAELKEIRQFRKKRPDMEIIAVEQQGLAYARVAGIKRAKGRQLVFFDDDNEPDVDYLTELTLLINRYPSVAVWGPGSVDVEFVDGIDPRLALTARPVFQGKEVQETAFACIRSWQPCYPFGTGLCLSRSLVSDYIAQFEAGRLTATGRQGGSLASSEDVQLVMSVIAQGYAAGVAQGLRVTHLIPAKRANLPYMLRLAYRSNLSFHTSISEVIPDYRRTVSPLLHRPRRFAWRALRRYISARLKNNPSKLVDVMNYIGSMSSLYRLFERKIPAIVTFVLKQARIY